jgi:hypothetical protein
VTATAVEHRPLHRTGPEFASTNGDIAAGVGDDLGLVPDAEQQWLLDQIFAEDEDGLPACDDVCVVAPRQNLKSATLEIAALTDLYVYGVPLHVWTAHEFKTARKSFVDMRDRIKAHPDYASRTDFRDAHGEEAIFLDTGERIEFHARSGGSGRGFTCDRLTLDEAMYLQPGDLGALSPTGLTIPDFQVRYGSSAGKPISGALRDLRKRGRVGDNGLAYVEYGAELRKCGQGERCQHALGTADCALDDRELWWQANCALWCGRIDESAILKQRRRLTPAEFMREFFSWWEDPPNEEGGAFDWDRWKTLADSGAERGRSPVFALATPRDRSWCAIAVAWRRGDGTRQVQLIDDGYRPGTAWVPDRVAEIRRRWQSGRVLVDTNSRGLLPDDVATEPGEAEQAEAHNALADGIEARTVRHGNHPALNTAIRAARWKNRGATRALDRDGDIDVSPAAAAAMALHGLASVAGPPNIW